MPAPGTRFKPPPRTGKRRNRRQGWRAPWCGLGRRGADCSLRLTSPTAAASRHNDGLPTFAPTVSDSLFNALPALPDDRPDRATWFADVILPLPLPRLYTYRVPQALAEQVAVGLRVVVQFGKQKVLSCVVAAVHQTPPRAYEAKYVLEVIDEQPVVTAPQLRLFEWIAAYYMCTLGEVLNAALPAALKLSSESQVQLRPDYDPEAARYPLGPEEETLVQALRRHPETGEFPTLTFSDVGRLLDQPAFHKHLKSLLQKEVITLFESVQDKYAPKVVRRVRLAAPWAQEPEMVTELLDQLAKKPRQVDVILRYLQLVPTFDGSARNHRGLPKSTLAHDETLSDSALNTLLKNGIFEAFDQVESRFPMEDRPPQTVIELSATQTQARDEILRHFDQKAIVLLHGVTGSGKTEVYIDLIQQALDNGGQVLYLLPEIGLTAQIVRRLQRVFGTRLGVYHSKFSDNERVEVWNGVLSGRFSVIVGARSAVFLPFHHLGLVIVDEEHESSYKQYEPAPRYHARETALMLAQYHGARTLLGSATPAVETYYQCQSGRWGLVTLSQRFGSGGMPDFVLIDTKKARAQKAMQHDFTPDLLAAIQLRLDRREQVILFQNRRGYAPFITCAACAWIPKCPNCAVSLALHYRAGEIRCHYCGHHEPRPRQCPACGGIHVNPIGFGTEKIEEDLKTLLPEARVQRMDQDTTRGKNGHANIIAEFEKGGTNVLVGTQMVTKGLDFGNVSLVGILNADAIIHYPDFRAHERAFQLFTQVAGRAGRAATRGEVLIQTAQPAQPIFELVAATDYTSFYEKEIQERANYEYPPFVRVITLTIKHAEEARAGQAATLLVEELVARLPRHSVLGPEQPYVNRIRNLFLYEIHVKLARHHESLRDAKLNVREAITAAQTSEIGKGVRIVVDVDPI